MANKKTKRDLFNELLQLELTDEQRGFIEREITLLNNKNKAKEPDAETLQMIENVYTYIVNNPKSATIAMIRKHVDCTSQKITPIVAKLEKQGRVTYETVKGVRYFTVV